jgi:hypothetical protein
VRYGNAQATSREVSPQDGKAKNPPVLVSVPTIAATPLLLVALKAKAAHTPMRILRTMAMRGVAEKGDGRGEEAVEPENTPHKCPHEGPFKNPGKDSGDVHDGGPTGRSGDRNKTQSRGSKDNGNSGKKGGNDDVLCLQCLHLRSSSLLGYQTKHRIENPKVRKPSGLFSL